MNPAARKFVAMRAGRLTRPWRARQSRRYARGRNRAPEKLALVASNASANSVPARSAASAPGSAKEYTFRPVSEMIGRPESGCQHWQGNDRLRRSIAGSARTSSVA